jgi:uncharacterized membrane protein YgdD (TMEM256/DUF423 family)
MGWVATGAVCCALAIAAGAFGAHGLEERLEARQLGLWETAARYLMYGGFGLIAIGLASEVISRPLRSAGLTLSAGTVVFSGTVFVLALGGPRWFGAITPVGGSLMILGFVFLAFAAWRA